MLRTQSFARFSRIRASHCVALCAATAVLVVAVTSTVYARATLDKRVLPRASQAISDDTTLRRTRVVLARDLPPMDGRQLHVTATEVNYGPGEASRPHDHPCPVVAYVTEGVIRSQVRGEPEATYRMGDGFYESPHRTHVVSANASASVPARFIAFMICDGKSTTTDQRTSTDSASHAP